MRKLNLNLVRKGDILLVRNYLDIFCWMISWATRSRWTHTTWILDKKYLLESNGQGVIKTPIKRYLNKRHYKVKLLRLKGISKLKIDKAMSFAKLLKHKHNHLKFLWTLLLVGINYIRRRPIMSCSGFVAYCLSNVNFYFNNKKNPLLISPADINRSRRTENVN